MAKYIPKEPLVAEIEKAIKIIYAGREYVDIPYSEECIVYGLQKAEDIINTFEVKEVDLEKELVDYLNDNFIQCNDGTLLSSETGSELAWYDYECIAKHFFELGIKAQKGEYKND